MEKLHLYAYALVFSSVFSLSLLAFLFCIVAEFKKSKVEDVKLDGRLCELPGSEAFGFGLAALGCFSMAQIIGNLIVFIGFWNGSSSGKTRSCCQAKRPTFATILLVISWLIFGIAIVLMGTATSMSRKQAYGKGWLNGECYVIKDGIFIGAAILVLLSLSCTLASAVTTMRKRLQASGGRKAPKSVRTSGIK